MQLGGLSEKDDEMLEFPRRLLQKVVTPEIISQETALQQGRTRCNSHP